MSRPSFIKSFVVFPETYKQKNCHFHQPLKNGWDFYSLEGVAEPQFTFSVLTRQLFLTFSQNLKSLFAYSFSSLSALFLVDWL